MNEHSCIYCGKLRGVWQEPCDQAPDKRYHWTAKEKIHALEESTRGYEQTLCRVNRLLLVGARALQVCEMRGKKRRRALGELPRRPDSLDLECEAAKISDTMAVFGVDPNLPTSVKELA